MKRYFSLTTLILTLSFAFPTPSFAQDDHTAREEAEGKAVWEKLQAKELNCEDLSADGFAALGEYFMGQMTVEQHEVMNKLMMQMMGEEGEEQMHIAMGKRMSGCEPEAPGMMSMMMKTMTGGGMMNDWPSILGLLTWLALLVFLIFGAMYFWQQLKKEKEKK